MKQLKIGLAGMGVMMAFLAFTRTNPVVHRSGHAIAAWQDTIPFRHYSTSKIYLDPSSGDSIEIWMDPASHTLMNKRTNSIVTVYIDPVSADTFYGEGYVVNNLVTRMPDGKYMVDSTKVKVEGNKIKYKDGDVKGKVKIENNKIKAKDGNDKIKVKDKGDTVKVKKG